MADENGFQVDSDLVPTPHPLPAHAIAQIEKAERERAAGIIHDGSYREEDHFGTSGGNFGSFGGNRISDDSFETSRGNRFSDHSFESHVGSNFVSSGEDSSSDNFGTIGGGNQFGSFAGGNQFGTSGGGSQFGTSGGGAHFGTSGGGSQFGSGFRQTGSSGASFSGGSRRGSGSFGGNANRFSQRGSPSFRTSGSGSFRGTSGSSFGIALPSASNINRRVSNQIESNPRYSRSSDYYDFPEIEFESLKL